MGGGISFSSYVNGIGHTDVFFICYLLHTGLAVRYSFSSLKKGDANMTAQRMLFLVMAILISIGIYLTGYQSVHWFLYIPAAALIFAGVTGICPGLMLFKKLGFK